MLKWCEAFLGFSIKIDTYFSLKENDKVGSFFLAFFEIFLNISRAKVFAFFFLQYPSIANFGYLNVFTAVRICKFLNKDILHLPSILFWNTLSWRTSCSCTPHDVSKVLEFASLHCAKQVFSLCILSRITWLLIWSAQEIFKMRLYSHMQKTCKQWSQFQQRRSLPLQINLNFHFVAPVCIYCYRLLFVK